MKLEMISETGNRFMVSGRSEAVILRKAKLLKLIPYEGLGTWLKVIDIAASKR